ncbi:MAG: ATP synthase subunit I [Gammaproteobacteria bacterium]|jgi:ATP synthase protein I|nr:ATP synthase subunit I [Gammaproteobacteria bacterium]
MLHRVYTAPRAIRAQFGLGFALAAALLPWGRVGAYSALIGGLVAATGSALFALGVFGRYQASQPGALAGRLVATELLKLAWAAALFLLAVRTVHPLSPAAMFLAFLAVQLTPAVVAAKADRQSTVERAGSWPRKP